MRRRMREVSGGLRAGNSVFVLGSMVMRVQMNFLLILPYLCISVDNISMFIGNKKRVIIIILYKMNKI